MAENSLEVAPTVEEAITTILEDNEITTEWNGKVIFSSGFSQGGEESATTTIAFNSDDKYHLGRAEVAI